MKSKTKKDQQIKELTETLQRVQAEFENFKKQVDKRTPEMEKMAAKKIVAELLPVLDSFQLALKSKKNAKECIDGMELVYSQLFSILEKEGLKPIKAVGEKFDPYKHEALLKEESKEEEDMVIDEMQKGYTLNGQVIRFSKVKLSKGTEKSKMLRDKVSGITKKISGTTFGGEKK
ncbi:MAG: nucleotide exchange factor GrpE [Nanoarchaeota archaeon]|nr:nucleotide exchange factor GrpE [Nanoarchaeota archaeon]